MSKKPAVFFDYPGFMKATTAALFLDMSVSSFYELRNEFKIPSYKVQGKIRFSRTDLERFMAERLQSKDDPVDEIIESFGAK